MPNPDPRSVFSKVLVASDGVGECMLSGFCILGRSTLQLTAGSCDGAILLLLDRLIVPGLEKLGVG